MILADQYSTEAEIMKRNFLLALAMVGLVFVACQFSTIGAQLTAHERPTFTPDTSPWGPAPPFLAPGAQFAVLEGDPTASSGDYTIRLKMPAGYRIAPHFHPLRENVSVISPTFKLGMGDVFNTNKMTPFTAGSFRFLDPNMHHYAMACGEVVVQVHGSSPLQFNFINPEDDPSKYK